MNDKRVFLDSNILIYAYSENEPTKQMIARASFYDVECYISTQTLSEYCNVCIKKLKYPISKIDEDIKEIIFNYELYYLDENTISNALVIKNKFGFSYYDSQVIAAAIECNCDYLFSEDLQDGQIIDDIKIINPFK
jgi:predicted nucleic acid-binding protein